MMKAVYALIGLGALTALLPLATLAQSPAGQAAGGQIPKAAPGSRPEDAKAITAVVKEFIRGFEAGDPAALMALYTDDAQVSDANGTTVGRANIGERFAQYFKATPGAKIAVTVNQVRFLSPDVAVEDGKVAITPGSTSAGPPTVNAYQVIYVREGGKWLQSSVRDEPADEPGVPDRLKELEWLVGDWINEDSQHVVTTTCRWSEDRHYILRDFDVTVAGVKVLKGSQRIGWDPSAKRIRSWVFDSEGGFNEGLWSRSGDTWTIRADGVNHDGQTTTATMAVAKLPNGTLQWRSYDRARAGESLPDADTYVLVRRPPQPTAISRSR